MQPIVGKTLLCSILREKWKHRNRLKSIVHNPEVEEYQKRKTRFFLTTVKLSLKSLKTTHISIYTKNSHLRGGTTKKLDSFTKFAKNLTSKKFSPERYERYQRTQKNPKILLATTTQNIQCA